MSIIHIKVRDAGAVRTKAVYLAIGVNMDGQKEVLGLWIAQTEGAKFWLQGVMFFCMCTSVYLHLSPDGLMYTHRTSIDNGDCNAHH